MQVQLKETELVLLAESDAECYYLKHFFATNWAQIATDGTLTEEASKVFIKPMEQIKN